MVLFFLCIYPGVFGLLAGGILRDLPAEETNMAAINRIQKEAEARLDSGEFHIPKPEIYDFSVLGEDGRLLFSSSPGAPSSLEDSVRKKRSDSGYETRIGPLRKGSRGYRLCRLHGSA